MNEWDSKLEDEIFRTEYWQTSHEFSSDLSSLGPTCDWTLNRLKSSGHLLQRWTRDRAAKLATDCVWVRRYFAGIASCLDLGCQRACLLLGKLAGIPDLGCTHVSRRYMTSWRRAGSLLVRERIWYFLFTSFSRVMRPCGAFHRLSSTHLSSTRHRRYQDLGYCAAETLSHALLPLLEESISKWV